MNGYSTLPKIENKNIELPHFPTTMQALIFRMWEMVPVKKLAQIMRAEVSQIEALALDMGLPKQDCTEDWLVKGYITILRSCWHILPYEQILELFDWDEDYFSYILREDDGIGSKLGGFKPACEPVYYRELTEEEKRQTAKIKTVMEVVKEQSKEAFAKHAKPFDFYRQHYEPIVAAGKNPKDYPVVLSEEWFVDNRISEAAFYVDKFFAEMEEMWKLSLQKGNGKKRIRIDYLHEVTVQKEYHEIRIEPEEITILVSDSIGVLRALTYLEDLAKTVGGPMYCQKTYKRNPRFKNRIIYSYSGLYGNIFDEDIEKSYTDDQLYRYAKLGINGIWVPGVLYRMCEFPYEPSFSAGWQERLGRLKELVAKAGKFGIKVYMYLNEPKAMPAKFFEKYPEIKGHVDTKFFKGMVAMCTSKPEVLDYLRNAVKKLCEAVPEIGGFFTITCSESLTNCYSRVLDKETNCPVCAKRNPADIIAEINNTIAEGAHAVNPDIHVIAWSWGWVGRNMDYTETEDCIVKTIKDITIMCTSEEAMEYTIGGCTGKERDYAMSMIGPGERSRYVWAAAAKAGHRTGAKVQVNCTWECASVPFIPVQNNVETHLKRLLEQGVEDILLSWTLGGYPSDNLKITSSYFFDCNEDVDLYQAMYGAYGDRVKEASVVFSEAFREFPFSVKTLYNGPQNPGPSNLLYEKPTGFEATVTCYSYDELERWYDDKIFSRDVFVSQWKKMCNMWTKGEELIREMPDCELKDAALACGAIFRSAQNQMEFIIAREKGCREGMLAVLDAEEACAKQMYRIMLQNPCIGYEAANHYIYNRTQMLEKILNCRYLKEVLSQKESTD